MSGAERHKSIYDEHTKYAASFGVNNNNDIAEINSDPNGSG